MSRRNDEKQVRDYLKSWIRVREVAEKAIEQGSGDAVMLMRQDAPAIYHDDLIGEIAVLIVGRSNAARIVDLNKFSGADTPKVPLRETS